MYMEALESEVEALSAEMTRLRQMVHRVSYLMDSVAGIPAPQYADPMQATLGNSDPPSPGHARFHSLRRDNGSETRMEHTPPTDDNYASLQQTLEAYQRAFPPEMLKSLLGQKVGVANVEARRQRSNDFTKEEVASPHGGATGPKDRSRGTIPSVSSKTSASFGSSHRRQGMRRSVDPLSRPLPTPSEATSLSVAQSQRIPAKCLVDMPHNQFDLARPTVDNDSAQSTEGKGGSELDAMQLRTLHMWKMADKKASLVSSTSNERRHVEGSEDNPCTSSSSRTTANEREEAYDASASKSPQAQSVSASARSGLMRSNADCASDGGLSPQPPESLPRNTLASSHDRLESVCGGNLELSNAGAYSYSLLRSLTFASPAAYNLQFSANTSPQLEHLVDEAHPSPAAEEKKLPKQLSVLTSGSSEEGVPQFTPNVVLGARRSVTVSTGGAVSVRSQQSRSLPSESATRNLHPLPGVHRRARNVVQSSTASNTSDSDRDQCALSTLPALPDENTYVVEAVEDQRSANSTSTVSSHGEAESPLMLSKQFANSVSGSHGYHGFLSASGESVVRDIKGDSYTPTDPRKSEASMSARLQSVSRPSLETSQSQQLGYRSRDVVSGHCENPDYSYYMLPSQSL